MGENVAVSVIKVPENGDKNAFVIRVFNASVEDANGSVKILKEVLNAEETNLNEEKMQDILNDKNSINFTLSPWQIKTFKIYYKN